MPGKEKLKPVKAAEPKIPKGLLDQLITGPITQSEFETIYRALKKAIIEADPGTGLLLSEEERPARR